MIARAAALVSALALGACATLHPKPQIITRVDTVTVTKEVAAPLPTGDTATVCLSTGVPVQVLVSARGDTLVGDARIPIKAVRPILSFQGEYASDHDWYERADTLRFDNRLYRRAGMARKRDCDELKLVGDYKGVPLFADVTAAQKLPMIVVPVSPGIFQPFMVTTPPATGKRGRR